MPSPFLLIFLFTAPPAFERSRKKKAKKKLREKGGGGGIDECLPHNFSLKKGLPFSMI